eukprot:scaffold37001_cov89-Phaeocystis_antarctica.AAC.1
MYRQDPTRQLAASSRPGAAPALFSPTQARARATVARPVSTRAAKASKHVLLARPARTAPRVPGLCCRARRARTPTVPTSAPIASARQPCQALTHPRAAPIRRRAAQVLYSG